MKIRMAVPVALMFLFMFAISACSGGIGINKEPVEVHFQSGFPESFKSDPLIQPFMDAVADFNLKDPQIQVILDYLPPLEGNTGFYTVEDHIKLLESEHSPDIIGWGSSQIQEAKDKGVFRDLLPLVNKGIDIPQHVLDIATVDGELLALPFAAYPSGIIYNKDIFDESEVPYPEGEWTWEQFRDISKKLKSPYGSVLTYEIDTLDMLLASNAGGILSPDGQTAVGFLDSPAAVRSIQWLNDYYRDDDDKSVPMTEFFGYFHDAQAGMIVAGIGTQFARFQGENKKKLGAAPMPYFEGGKRANPVGFRCYGISAKSEHPEAAWAFIEYLALSDNEHARKLAEGYIPTSKTLAEAMSVDADPEWAMYNDELNYSYSSAGTINPYFREAWNEELAGQFRDLFKAEDGEIEGKLHELALKLDQGMKRLSNITG